MNTIIEQIKVKIEWLKKEGETALQGAVKTNDIEKGLVCGGIVGACKELLAKLDTLKEQPVCEGLEEEIKRYYEDMDGDCRYAQTARHFAQWGAEHRGSSETPNDLEEAAHSYSESDEPLYSPGHRFHWDSDSLFGKQIETTFKAGAKWQKEQMLKEAVEGAVSARFGTISIPQNIYEKYDGKIVKLVVIKED